jgi:hypothetical protein
VERSGIARPFLHLRHTLGVFGSGYIVALSDMVGILSPRAMANRERSPTMAVIRALSLKGLASVGLPHFACTVSDVAMMA